ncbi:MAG: hypothetical protein Q8Q70_16580 [Phenylobacterium sp.]|nr:hypothetical protein [Phenylobacterium sp.]
MDNSHSDLGPQVLLEVGRLTGRVEQFLLTQSRTEARLDHHDRRIGALEAAGTTQTGFRKGAILVASGLAAGATWFLTHLTTFGGLIK